MDEFVYFDGWFDRFKLLVGPRFPTFKIALNVLLVQGGRTIVETGSMRNRNSWMGDGCSTLLFAEFAASYDRQVWSCDINPVVVEYARRACAAFAANVTHVCSDSVSFLEAFPHTIDLLYLDSFDCDIDPTGAQQHNVRELEAAFPKLGESSLVLLDDNAFENGGKTRLSKQHLLEAGWLCLYDDAQSLWVNPAGFGQKLVTPVTRREFSRVRGSSSARGHAE